MTDNIDVGQLSEAINDKMDRDANNAEDALRADYVIDYQAPTADNNYTWYRLYRSGWVEQGGIVDITGSVSNGTITLPKSFSSTNYIVLLSKLSNVDYDTSTYDSKVRVQNVGSFTYSCHVTTATGKIFWEAKGMSAQS